ncbi:MAG: hypothetical protein ACR2J9_00420 [Gaiellales bacterium]
MHGRRLILPLVILALLAGSATASASTLVTRNPQSGVSLKVNRNGVALLTVKVGGRWQHILAWGAVNLSRGRLRLDFSGGQGASGANWQTFVNVCQRYRGEKFTGSEMVVAQCTAPDGSHWAVQEWKRSVRNYGGTTGPTEVRLSHWTGAVADLEVFADWSRYGPSPGVKWPHLFGTYSWHGIPVAVGEATPQGVPLDDDGRNLYLDSLNADYGFPAGTMQWSRVNGFLANRPYGQFCFEIGPKGEVSRLAGISTLNRYRMTVSGPGVTPDIRVVFDGPPSPYDPYWELTMNEIQRQVVNYPNASCGNPPPPTF